MTATSNNIFVGLKNKTENNHHHHQQKNTPQNKAENPLICLPKLHWFWASL